MTLVEESAVGLSDRLVGVSSRKHPVGFLTCGMQAVFHSDAEAL